MRKLIIENLREIGEYDLTYDELLNSPIQFKTKYINSIDYDKGEKLIETTKDKFSIINFLLNNDKIVYNIGGRIFDYLHYLEHLESDRIIMNLASKPDFIKNSDNAMWLIHYSYKQDEVIDKLIRDKNFTDAMSEEDLETILSISTNQSKIIEIIKNN